MLQAIVRNSLLSAAVLTILPIVLVVNASGAKSDEPPDPLRRRYPDAAGVVESAIAIPGLTDGLIPQGIAVLSDEGVALLTFDHPDPERSSVCTLIDLRTQQLLYSCELRTAAGPFTGHAGGAAVCRGFLWVASEGRLWKFPLPSTVPGEAPTSLEATESFPVDSEASFVSAEGPTLWVGDFHRPASHPTPAHHHHGEHRGWLAAYRIGDDGRLLADQHYPVGGREVLQPFQVIFIGDQVQGCAVTDEVIAVSRSYGPADSRLEYYDRSCLGADFFAPVPNGGSVSAHELNAEGRLWSVPLPAGAEDLELMDDRGRLLISFEGGARKYRNRWRLAGAFIEDRFYTLAPLPPAAEAGLSCTANVDSTRVGWTAAGMRVRAGQTIRIQASGRVTLQRHDQARYPFADADGIMQQLRTFEGIRAANGSLVVRIGNDVYSAGRETILTTERGGPVSLGIVENGDHANNEGAFNVELWVTDSRDSDK